MRRGAWSVLARKWATWRGLGARQRHEVLHAWLRLGVVDLLLLVMPFRRLAPQLGESVSPSVDSPPLALGDVLRARRIAANVRRAARYSPWPAKCLAQALVTRRFLHANGIACVVRLGLSKEPSAPSGSAGMKAHAWVECADAVIIGGRGSRDTFTRVASFLTPGRRGHDVESQR
ncbi:MAG: lasso peptide biosynthesis B2 protein [Gammaproteobacteria bacterium]